jgi:mycofactocin precursor
VPKRRTEARPIRFCLEELQMSHADTPVITPDITADTSDTGEIQDDLLVEDDELVEEISIDGMCGVY